MPATATQTPLFDAATVDFLNTCLDELFARRRVPAASRDDLRQDIWVKLVTRAGTYDPSKGSVIAFGVVIGQSVIRDRHRRRNVEQSYVSGCDTEDFSDNEPRSDRMPTEEAALNRVAVFRNRIPDELFPLLHEGTGGAAMHRSARFRARVASADYVTANTL